MLIGGSSWALQLLLLKPSDVSLPVFAEFERERAKDNKTTPV